MSSASRFPLDSVLYEVYNDNAKAALGELGGGERRECLMEHFRSIAQRAVFAVAATFAVAAFGVDTMTSDPKFVFLDTKTSSFWRTATNRVMTLPISYPAGATAATLTVTGSSWSMTTNIPAGFFDLVLPEPSAPETEDVYELALSFDDGTVRLAKLGLIQGLMPGADGATRCLVPQGGRRWNGFQRHAVLPLPYGAESFAVYVNGQVTASDSGLDGAKGWYALNDIRLKDAVTVSFTLNGASRQANLVSRSNTFVLSVK